jgi:Domain of unknown function (DUF932)
MASRESAIPAISILPGEASWRSRKVRYYSGDWNSIRTILPDFDLEPFTAGPDEPANPFLLKVMRRPLSAAERPIPVGVVSQTYSLASHREVVALCRDSLIDAGIEPVDLPYEVGLSELGEWMNFRVYFPDSYSFTDAHGYKLDLRLECFNCVDGASRLMILFGWFRFICANGLVIGETKIEIKERHGKSLVLDSIRERIWAEFEAVEADKSRMQKWQDQKVDIEGIAAWADKKLSEKWGKKAAARVFHICKEGKDIELQDPFAPGAATKKPFRPLGRVPGSPEHAATKYDVSQALSFVATHRNNTEERVAWQAEIPDLLQGLAECSSIRAG